jgi:hypothetical protein
VIVAADDRNFYEGLVQAAGGRLQRRRATVPA